MGARLNFRHQAKQQMHNIVHVLNLSRMSAGMRRDGMRAAMQPTHLHPTCMTEAVLKSRLHTHAHIKTAHLQDLSSLESHQPLPHLDDGGGAEEQDEHGADELEEAEVGAAGEEAALACAAWGERRRHKGRHVYASRAASLPPYRQRSRPWEACTLLSLCMLHHATPSCPPHLRCSERSSPDSRPTRSTRMERRILTQRRSMPARL